MGDAMGGSMGGFMRDVADGGCCHLKVTYTRRGAMMWLSDREMARTLERCVRRSGLPFVITSKPYPRPDISCGEPLQRGETGREGTFELELAEHVDPDVAYRRCRTHACRTSGS